MKTFLKIIFIGVPFLFITTHVDAGDVCVLDSSYVCSECVDGPLPPTSSPGGDHPDETFAVDSGFTSDVITHFDSDPDAVIFQNGFSEELSNVFNNFKKAEILSNDATTAFDFLETTPSLIIPSGGLYGMGNSAFFKATLDEYVKQGGTLIVFAQQRGYEFNILPTPDGKPVTGYGWTEDQSCFTNGVYIDTWHQMLSGQSRATPTMNVDGYFTGIPDNSTVLLRRTANGQPALIMYPHGNGRVIATTMYSDWAFAHGQASPEETALVRDMISWAKDATILPEISPGGTVDLNLEVNNLTSESAANIKYYVYDPDRKNLLQEVMTSQSLAPGESLTIPFTYTTQLTSPLGIYHIDYELYDSAGNILQPRAESNSGRYAVRENFDTGKPDKEIWFTASTPSQDVFLGDLFHYSFHIYNNSEISRNFTIKAEFPHTERTREFNVAAIANGVTHVNSSDYFIDDFFKYETLKAYLYDENGEQIGNYMLSFRAKYSKVDLQVSTDKSLYEKGETVNMGVNVVNSGNDGSEATVNVTVTDPANSVLFINTLNFSNYSGSNLLQNVSFLIPENSPGGHYTVYAEAFDAANSKVGTGVAGFDIPVSRIEVKTALPPVMTEGLNRIGFSLNNIGDIDISSGKLDIAFREPDGTLIYSDIHNFALLKGESQSFDISVSIPSLKFGDYSLVFIQSDETKPGRAATVRIPNKVTLKVSPHIPAYRIRETANIIVQVANIGRFNQESISAELSVPDAGYTGSQVISLPVGGNGIFTKSLLLPETMKAGLHKINVNLTLPGGSIIARSFDLVVSAASLETDLSEQNYNAGDTISGGLINRGGQDAEIEYRLRLYDKKATLIAEEAATGMIMAGEPLSTGMTVPPGAVEGIYDLEIYFNDLTTGQTGLVKQVLNISGVRAKLDVRTVKELYPLTEGVGAFSLISSGGLSAPGSNLHVKVTNATGTLSSKTWTSQYDFQQQTRYGIDTYGVNDWMIPKDDFDWGGVDSDRWSVSGNVITYSKHLSVDSSVTDSYLESKWEFDGDFDVQVDFQDNNSAGNRGAELGIVIGASYVSINSSLLKGYYSTRMIGETTLESGSQGAYSMTGKLRVKREASTISAYYFESSSWVEVYRETVPEFMGDAKIRLGLWLDESGNGGTANFDRFKLNSGLIKTIYETVDSVRLLPINDNFDDGLWNEDRWLKWGADIPRELSGALHLDTTSADNNGWSWVHYRQYLFSGNFNLYSEYRDFSSYFGFGATNNEASFYMLRGIDNIEGDYLTGLACYGSSCSMGNRNLFTMTPDSTLLRLKRSGNMAYMDFWYGNSWVNFYSKYGTSTEPMGMYHYVSNNKTADIEHVYTDAGKHVKSGTVYFKYDSENPANNWKFVDWTGDTPTGTSIKIKTRTAETEADLNSALWSEYITTNNAVITSPDGRWIQVQAWLQTSNAAVTPVLHDLTVTSGREPGQVIWESNVPVDLAAGSLMELNHAVGTIDSAGKYFMEGTLTSATGQTVATSRQPFFMVDGEVAIAFNSDKRVYKPGETVNITGQVINLSAVPFTSLNLALNTNGQNIFASTIDIAESGTYLFNTTVIAGTEGTMKLTGMVTQNGSALADLSDEVTVSAPLLTAVLTAPDVVGSAPFNLVLELANEGLVDTEVQVNVMEDGITIAGEAVLVPAGELKRVVYERSIAQDMAYNVNITGELTSMLDHNVSYGEAATIIINNSVSPFIEEAGYIEIPVAINNTGQLGETVTINYALTPSGMTETKSYFLPVGATVTDTLFYNLSSGDYSLSATASQPSVSAEALLKVVNIDDAAMSLSHSTGTDSIININSELVNNGWNSIDGTVKISLEGGNGAIAWQGEAEVTALLSQSTGSYSLSLNPSAVEAGAYLIKGTLLNNAGIELASASTTLVIADSNVGLTAIPGYDTFIPGGEGTFAFTAMNSGGREGEMALSLKVFDVINDSKAGWLKAGEEKQVNFAFRLPDDLEEKDYFADYELKNGAGDTIEKGQVKFHLAGIDIGVNASLDKANYRNGETANLTFDISNLAPEMQGLNLFARVNYAGHEEQRPFVLNSTETLTFNVPLPEITGEKLFYGIYHGEGRSIHLNTLYIYKAGDVLTVMTDKQVYNPGETIVATITGEVPGLSGSMTLTGPDNFVETFDFSGSATRNILLPAIMKAGTYQINAQLDSASSGIIEANHPVDVNGIQVKVTEASLDKARYNATDTMNLDLQVESNTDITTDLKTWVIYPTGNNELVGGEPLALSSTEPVRISHSAPLTTEYLGIHRLVYGIYAGNLLLASGSEAFDVGSAVLNGVSTDKHEYANVGEPVTVSLNMYGTVAADIELYIDDELIGTEAVSLSGYETKTVVLDGTVVHPGNHILRAVLLSGELKSEKETNFKYGTLLPDLIVHLETSDNGTAASKDLNATVTNQGKTASTASSVAFYDRSPDSGLAIGQVSIAPLEAGESVTVSYSWSLLGKAGSHTLYALVDPENTVSEFIEFNNSEITTIQINDVDLKVSTSAESYEANKSVGIIKDVINFTAYSSLSNVTLQRKVSGPAGEVDSSSELIASLSPGEASYVDSWNTATSMPGSYNVEASLSAPVILNGQVTGEELLAADSTTFEVLPTISVAGAMTLSSNEVIQGFPLGINYSLINNGNMDVTGAELSTSVRSLSDNSSTVLGTFQIAALGVLESYSGLMAIDSVSVEPGDYKATLDLTADGKLIEIAEAGLIVKPPLRVEKMISTLPRVLVWTPLTTDQQVTTNEIIATTALSEMGAYYRIAHNENEFKEAMRSGYFNLFMLLETGKPTTGDLTAELTERVRGGSSLVLAGKSGLDDLKVQGVTGTKFTGYYMIKTLATTSISQPLFETPFNLTVDGKVQKLETLSNLVEVAATIEDKGNLYPSLTVNRYGNGMAVNFSFDLGISAEATGSLSSYIALLSNVVSYANPQPDVMVAGTVLPVEIKVESLGSAFDLKVREDAGLLTVLDSNMNGAIDTAENRITWNSHLPVNGVDRFMYLAALPDGAGTFNTSTEIYYLKNGEEKLYNSYSLNTDIPEGVAQLETNIVASITALAVSPTESAIRDSALSRFEALIISPNSTRNDLDNRIHELLKVIDDLEKLSIDATEIVGKLDDLLITYERKWVLVQ